MFINIHLDQFSLFFIFNFISIQRKNILKILILFFLFVNIIQALN